jgi:hypothetical protein
MIRTLIAYFAHRKIQRLAARYRAMPSAPALALRVGPIFVVLPLRASIRIAGEER